MNNLTIKMNSKILGAVANEPVKLQDFNQYCKREKVNVVFFLDKVRITYIRERTFPVPYLSTIDEVISWTKKKIDQVMLMPAPFNF